MMKRRFLGFLLVIVLFSSVALAGCNPPPPSINPILGDALFHLIDLGLNFKTNKFAVWDDSILLADDAIKLITTIRANQTPPMNVKQGFIRVSILYDKQGVLSQDVYDVHTRQASLGIFLEGGTTFESISGNRVDIDATRTQKITMVPLQHSTSKFTVSAKKGWQNTGIFVEKGKQFRIKYLSGIWTISKGSVGTSDAAGEPINPPTSLICRCGEPLEGYSTQGLIGEIGAGLGHAPLQVGDDFAGVAYDNEFLYLRMNLADQLLPNSSGSVTVSIETNNG